MGYCLSTAKGAAETLKFNMALILFPVCRNSITWLRKNCLELIEKKPQKLEKFVLYSTLVY